MTVRYSVSALVRSGIVGGGAVQFVTRDDPNEALPVFRSAAKQVEARHAEAGMDGEDFISTGGFVAVPDGVVAVFGVCDNANLLSEWLDVVAAQLEQAGFSGRIQRPRDLEVPSVNAPMMVVGIPLIVERDAILAAEWQNWNPPINWWVSDERTRRVLPALVSWCLSGPGDVYVRAGVGMPVDPEAVESLVLRRSHLLLGGLCGRAVRHQRPPGPP